MARGLGVCFVPIPLKYSTSGRVEDGDPGLVWDIGLRTIVGPVNVTSHVSPTSRYAMKEGPCG